MRLTPTPEIARIHAHICGDGCVSRVRDWYSEKQLARHPRRQAYSWSWCIYYTNTCVELIEEFRKDVLIAFNRRGSFNPKQHTIKISAVKWIVDALDLANKNSHTWHIPSEIMNAPVRISASWIRAFFDDESTVAVEKKMIRAKSVNLRGLHQVKELLHAFGISAKITGPNCDGTWYINLYRKDILPYLQSIGFTHPEKTRKLKEIMSPP